MKRRISGVPAVAATGTAFASLAGMSDQRHGNADRRASKRGGRRATDMMRSDVVSLRRKWEALDIADTSFDADEDELEADHAALGPARRPPVPPRK
jgi:hypothetical protein